MNFTRLRGVDYRLQEKWTILNALLLAVPLGTVGDVFVLCILGRHPDRHKRVGRHHICWHGRGADHHFCRCSSRGWDYGRHSCEAEI